MPEQCFPKGKCKMKRLSANEYRAGLDQREALDCRLEMVIVIHLQELASWNFFKFFLTQFLDCRHYSKRKKLLNRILPHESCLVRVSPQETSLALEAAPEEPSSDPAVAACVLPDFVCVSLLFVWEFF